MGYFIKPRSETMNQLTPENLDMIKRLQPLFREKLGDIVDGDELVNPFSDKGRTGFVCGNNQMGLDDCLRIPKPIDWQNPERGLDGMLKWPYQLQRLKNGTCKLYTKTYSDGAIEAPDPFTALLKALCEQEEV